MIIKISGVQSYTGTSLLSLVLTHINLLTLTSGILAVTCAVLQNFIVMKYLNLGGQTLRYLLGRDIMK